ncbi:hypothetical protein QJQ45_010085 [Haematococcus lacustris]|nr:hypothetical protein QJQ45_010085 [Haematococcus lacustris]
MISVRAAAADVEPLMGHNYSKWSWECKNALALAGLLDAVIVPPVLAGTTPTVPAGTRASVPAGTTPSVPEGTDQAEGGSSAPARPRAAIPAATPAPLPAASATVDRGQDLRAHAFICLTVDATRYRSVCEANPTARGLWVALAGQHAQRALASRGVLLEQVTRLGMLPGQSVTEYWAHAEQLHAEANPASSPPIVDTLYFALRGLQPEFDPVSNPMLTQRDAAVTFASALPALLMHEQVLQHRQSAAGGVALLAHAIDVAAAAAGTAATATPLRTQWLLDSGCSRHVTCNLDMLHDYQPTQPPHAIEVANGAQMTAWGEGSVRFSTAAGEVVLLRVLYVPDASANLLSMGKALRDLLVLDQQPIPAPTSHNMCMTVCAEQSAALCHQPQQPDKVAKGILVGCELGCRSYRVQGRISKNVVMDGEVELRRSAPAVVEDGSEQQAAPAVAAPITVSTASGGTAGAAEGTGAAVIKAGKGAVPSSNPTASSTAANPVASKGAVPPGSTAPAGPRVGEPITSSYSPGIVPPVGSKDTVSLLAVIPGAHADADYAGDPDSMRSTSGTVFVLNGAAISLRSQLQTTVAASTTEAETQAAAAATKEALFLRKVLHHLGASCDPIPIFCDNQGAVALIKNPMESSRSRHIAVAHHLARERQARGEQIKALALAAAQAQMAETKGLSEQPQREHAPRSRSRPTSAPAPQRSVAEGGGMREALQKQAAGAWHGRSDLAGARKEVVRRARIVARLQTQYDSTVRRFCAAHRQHGGQWSTRHDLEEGDEAVVGHGGEEEGVGRRRGKEGGQQKTRRGGRMRESEGEGGALQLGKAEQATIDQAKAGLWPGQQQGGQAPVGPLEAWDEVQSVLAVVDIDSLIRAPWSGQKHSSSGRHLLSPMRCMFSAALQSLSSHLPGCGAGLALAALPLPFVGSAASGSALVRLLRMAGGGVLGPGSEAAGCVASWLLRGAYGGPLPGTTSGPAQAGHSKAGGRHGQQRTLAAMDPTLGPHAALPPQGPPRQTQAVTSPPSARPPPHSQLAGPARTRVQSREGGAAKGNSPDRISPPDRHTCGSDGSSQDPASTISLAAGLGPSKQAAPGRRSHAPAMSRPCLSGGPLAGPGLPASPSPAPGPLPLGISSNTAVGGAHHATTGTRQPSHELPAPSLSAADVHAEGRGIAAAATRAGASTRGVTAGVQSNRQVEADCTWPLTPVQRQRQRLLAAGGNRATPGQPSGAGALAPAGLGAEGGPFSAAGLGSGQVAQRYPLATEQVQAAHPSGPGGADPTASTAGLLDVFGTRDMDHVHKVLCRGRNTAVQHTLKSQLAEDAIRCCHHLPGRSQDLGQSQWARRHPGVAQREVQLRLASGLPVPPDLHLAALGLEQQPQAQQDPQQSQQQRQWQEQQPPGPAHPQHHHGGKGDAQQQQDQSRPPLALTPSPVKELGRQQVAHWLGRQQGGVRWGSAPLGRQRRQRSHCASGLQCHGLWIRPHTRPLLDQAPAQLATRARAHGDIAGPDPLVSHQRLACKPVWDTSPEPPYWLPGYVNTCIGADAAARDRDGRTALHLAVITGCEARVRLLLHAAQADLDVQDAAGYTALHLAVHRACGSPVMAMLLLAGADVNVADRDGRTPLHLAALRPHRHCAGTGCCSLAALLRAGAAADAQDKDGRTPLHCVLLEGVEAAQLDKVQHINHHKAAAAAARTHPRALQWPCRTLLAHGAPPNLPDALGRTPLHLAVAASSLAAAQLLLKAGADWLAADHAGATPASMAQASPRTATLARLLAAHDAGEVGGELSRAHSAPVPGGDETADLRGPGSSCNPGDRRKAEAVPLSGAVAESRVKNERRPNDATTLHQGPGARVTSAVGPRGGAAVMKAMELQHLRGRVPAGLLTDSGSDSGTEV